MTQETIVGLGARTDYLAQVPVTEPTRLRLTPEEGKILAAIGRASRIDEIIARSGLAEPRAIALLLSLRAKGAVVPAKVTPPPPAAAIDAAMAEEIDLPADRKKEILDLERGLDRLDHFQILGLMPGATAEEIRRAYFAASKRYHPDRYYGKNVGSFRARIDRVFRRLSEAYETLNDPDKRAAYLRANPQLDVAPAAAAPAPADEPEPEAEPSSAVDPQRAAERRSRMARHPYLARTTKITELVHRAKAQIAKGEPGRALADLHLALQIQPNNKELEALQTEARHKHDLARSAQEMEKAVEAEAGGDLANAMARFRTVAALDPANARAAFKAAQLMRLQGQDPKEVRILAQRAVDLDGKNADARVLLGTILAEADLKKLARKQFEEALQLNPAHPEAKKYLKKTRWPF
ncbi:MAG TPA: DnaJ domain-containing protein [Myxococcaceae bacterium]|nr:DnaJ domain-containing protein [Myxococcaceae bacterium]